MNYTSASVDIIAFTGAGAKALKMMGCYWYTGTTGTTYLANLGAATGFAYTMLHDNLYHGPDSVASGAVTSNANNVSY